MIAYRIEDMTCGGCVRAIRAAVAKVTPSATVQADVGERLVRIGGIDDATAIEAAIRAAGFDAVAVEPAVAAEPAATGGCGGGGCRCGG